MSLAHYIQCLGRCNSQYCYLLIVNEIKMEYNSICNDFLCYSDYYQSEKHPLSDMI